MREKYFHGARKNCSQAMLTFKIALSDSPHSITISKNSGFRALHLGFLSFNEYIFFHFWLLASARKI